MTMQPQGRPPLKQTPWQPPKPEVLQTYLDRHPSAAPSVWTQRGPLLMLGVLIAGALFVGGPAAWLLPWVGMIGLMIYGGRRLRQLQRLERRIERAQELAMLRHDRVALRSAWRLIPELQQQPMMQHRVILVIANGLESLGAYESAIVAYHRLLRDLSSDHPAAVHLKTRLAIASLMTDRLSDADEALRRLRGPIEPLQAGPIGATYRFASMLQAVRTAHYAEAIEESDGLLESLRPLGVDAGYGHALLAWCYRQRNDEGDAQQAEHWWDRATRLISESQLVQRLPELRGMVQRD